MKRLETAAGGILALIGAAVIIFVLSGCAKPAPPLSPVEIAIVSAAVECDQVIAREIAKHDTCPPVQLAVDLDRACRAAFPKGVNLDCPEYRK